MGLDGTDPRKCAEIAKQAGKYDCMIVIDYMGKTVSMKSLIGLISMGIAVGEDVTVRADGAGEKEALDALTACIG